MIFHSYEHDSVSYSDEVLALDPKPQTLDPLATRMSLTQLKKAVFVPASLWQNSQTGLNPGPYSVKLMLSFCPV